MQRIQPDVWETDVENPFEGLYTHAYLLQRDDGNVLFYNTGHPGELEQMAALGGVRRQYLSHRDELGDSLNTIAERFGAELAGHEAELEDFSRFRRPTIVMSRRETQLGNIEVIPTPGHSPGSTCFLVHSPLGRDYLFTGDTLWLKNGTTPATAYFPESSQLDDYVKSLGTLRDLAPDVMIASATSGHGGYRDIEPGQWPGLVDQALARLLRQHA